MGRTPLRRRTVNQRERENYSTSHSFFSYLSLFWSSVREGFFPSPKNDGSNDRELLINFFFFFFSSCAEMSSLCAQSLIKHVLNTTRWKQPCSRISDRRIDELRKSVWCGNTTVMVIANYYIVVNAVLEKEKKKKWRVVLLKIKLYL